MTTITNPNSASRHTECILFAYIIHYKGKAKLSDIITLARVYDTLLYFSSTAYMNASGRTINGTTHR